jgi:hypothetical protein
MNIIELWENILKLFGKDAELAKLIGYDITYYGTIVDLDPSLVLTYASASNLIFTNRTEGSSVGARLTASILSMDFNSPAEATNNINISYVKDGSVYNNFGQIGISTSSASRPTYNATGGYDGFGAYVFDGVDDVITNTITPTSAYTISGWIKNSTATSWSHIVWSSNGTNYTNGIVSNPIQKPFNWTRIGLTGATYFNGTIDNLQIFNYALTADQILSMYNGTLNKTNKYSSTQGDFKSEVFYNSTPSYWNITLSHSANPIGSIADVNGINLSNANLVSYYNLDGNSND